MTKIILTTMKIGVKYYHRKGQQPADKVGVSPKGGGKAMKVAVPRSPVRAVERDGVVFYCVHFGYVKHGTPSFFVWVGESMKGIIKSSGHYYYIEYPVRNARIVKTSKGALVLRQGDRDIYNVYVQCGYCGESNLTVLAKAGIELIVRYYEDWASPGKKLGVGRGALVEIQKGEPFYVEWWRSGRAYGGPSMGVSKISVDGEEDIDNADVSIFFDRAG